MLTVKIRENGYKSYICTPRIELFQEEVLKVKM